MKNLSLSLWWVFWAICMVKSGIPNSLVSRQNFFELSYQLDYQKYGPYLWDIFFLKSSSGSQCFSIHLNMLCHMRCQINFCTYHCIIKFYEVSSKKNYFDAELLDWELIKIMLINEKNPVKQNMLMRWKLPFNKTIRCSFA